jgi:hypothetical protein
MSWRTFLLTWNPKFTPWDGRAGYGWSCGTRTDLPINSRVFLMRVGEVPHLAMARSAIF